MSELTAEQVVHNFVKPLYTNLSTLNPQEVQDVTETSEERELKEQARLAGFNNVVNRMEAQYYQEKHKATALIQMENEKQIILKAMNTLNLKILLKIPNFQTITLETINNTNYTRRDTFRRAIKIGETYKAIPWRTKKSLFNKVQEKLSISKEAVYLIEVDASGYKGEIPIQAIKASAQAVKAGLEPRVWIAGTEPELKEYVESTVTYKPVKIDPLVVGYAKDQQRFDHCVLIAVWGKDLETIDAYFQNGGGQ
jgi:hypothetical protein